MPACGLPKLTRPLWVIWLVTWTSARKRRSRSRQALEIDNVGVRPEWQRRGVGRQLMDHALEHARDRGIRTVTLTTWTFNKDAQAAFLKAVFGAFVNGLKPATREQTNSLHHRQLVPDSILTVRRIGEEATIVVRCAARQRPRSDLWSMTSMQPGRTVPIAYSVCARHAVTF